MEVPQKLIGITRTTLGLWGFGLLVFSGLRWWKVLSSPGDDNPISMIFMLGALASVVPLTGAFANKKVGILFWLWVIASLFILSVFTYFYLEVV